jgi:purine nucleosidase
VARKILIDTDTASDDAVALIMALRSRDVEVLGITTVGGNVAVEQATRNALFTVELSGATVPVYQGTGKPLLRTLDTAHWFHGHDGLGDHGYAPARLHAESENAVDAIRRIGNANPGTEIITLGPLTNVALALAADPGLAKKFSRCVVMGGAPCCEGNVTPAAEFNIWVDPEAAQVVFQSGLTIEMIGWQLSRGPAVMNAGDIDAALKLGTPAADFAVRSNSTAEAAFLKQTGERGIALPDPVAMSVLLQPALSLKASKHFVSIETSSDLTRGMTVVDRLNVVKDDRNSPVWSSVSSHQTPVTVCWELDVAGWKKALFAALI